VLRDERGRAVKLLVEHVNMVRRHTRPSQKRQGGIIEREAPVDVSNVMLVDAKTDKTTRFGVEQSKEGEKIRVSRSSGSPL
jgi:large subunit ribosomal protein L24